MTDALHLFPLCMFQDLHTTEKTKLITQLRDAKNLIEQLEQDKVRETRW